MKTNIGLTLKDANAKITGFMMRRVTFPATFSNRKLDAATQKLKNGAEGYRKQASVTRTETDKEFKILENKARLYKESAEAQSSEITKSATIQAVELEQNTRNTG